MFKNILFLLCLPLLSFGQGNRSFYSGLYKTYSRSYSNVNFQVYAFSRSGNRMKAKYFAQNAYRQYRNWLGNKRILFVCAGAFSEGWEEGSPPKGICVDNGSIVNRNLDYTMDGLIVVYNGGAQQGGIGVVNLEREPLKAVQGLSSPREFWVRNNTNDKNGLLRWGAQQGLTIFQTQLMYSSNGGFAFPNSQKYYGSTSNRRFLAICTRGGTVYHLVINMSSSQYLNYASTLVKGMLENENFRIIGLLNLDTGGKDIMLAYDSNGNLMAQGPVNVREATNMLVYYVD